MKKYHKIVRDRIPEIIAKSGKACETELVSGEEALLGLEEKLLEEVNEYLQSRDAEELSDILEVIHAIAYWRGMGFEDIERIRIEKREERGGFEKGIRLLSVSDGEDQA